MAADCDDGALDLVQGTAEPDPDRVAGVDAF